MTLDGLGDRICIIGPSNSGKSTLAVAIACARGIPAIHLDQMHHLPGTDWRPRPAEAFAALHDEAIRGEHWVMEGNYSRLFPARLERATGLILLEISTARSLLRYLRRSWFERTRVGGLEGARDHVTWDMIHHIMVVTPAAHVRRSQAFNAFGSPKVRLKDARALAEFYRTNDLTRGGG